MVELDDLWTKLEKSRKNGWRDGKELAVQLVEQYREIQRLPDVATRSSAFQQILSQAVAVSEELEAALRSQNDTRRDSAFTLSRSQCVSCHRDHRDRPVN